MIMKLSKMIMLNNLKASVDNAIFNLMIMQFAMIFMIITTVIEKAIAIFKVNDNHGLHNNHYVNVSNKRSLELRIN